MNEAHEFLREDDVLGPLVEEFGPLGLDPADDLYRRIVVSILRQQVSMASAAATRERLFAAVEPTDAARVPAAAPAQVHRSSQIGRAHV